MSPRFGAVVASAAAAATTAVGISFSWDTFSLVSWADFCSGLPVRAREACLFQQYTDPDLSFSCKVFIANYVTFGKI